MNLPTAVRAFAQLLRATRTPNPTIALGELSVSSKRTVIPSLQYNQEPFELLKGAHDYALTIGGQRVEVSCQLYLNTRNHYRLFAYSRAGSASGLLFSLNLTTAKDAKGLIDLSQRIRFFEGRGTEAGRARLIRSAKGRILGDILTRCGIPITDNLEISLGTYCTKTKDFLDTTAARFISQFLTVAVMKGHVQGNKGFQFACLPRFDDSFAWKWDSTDAVRDSYRPNRKGAQGLRAIPLALRYQVLERDKGACRLCGRSRYDDVVLHVDHITPFSLGGLTVLRNLRTLCSDCNLGKGNRSCVDDRAWGNGRQGGMKFAGSLKRP